MTLPDAGMFLPLTLVNRFSERAKVIIILQHDTAGRDRALHVHIY